MGNSIHSSPNSQLTQNALAAANRGSELTPTRDYLKEVQQKLQSMTPPRTDPSHK